MLFQRCWLTTQLQPMTVARSPKIFGLVHSVTMHPKPAQEGFEIEIKGKLAALIGGAAFPNARYAAERAASGARRNPNIAYDVGLKW
ncbi:hypothetical protein FJ970_10185 [Mesorhizobium sp. B2-1-8]|uniref:hypothetical protein n=1 Tax=Mesorhizobium sp. B2-1-8 TaxID=2589967 RepID=UPI001D11BCC6|nr:hypothetical protein [Mesorhizobium sp. B2-1-8]UCI21296.1 hypothetical protein FJ970_10185 [Mesorhizobium sp. B2-1-8]